MSAPRMIQILRCDCGACTAGRWKSAYFWRCRECLLESVGDPTLAAAADAGRAHLAEHHAQGYCRPHGARRSVCGCRVASRDPEPLFGPQEPAHDADVLRDPETLKVALSGAGKARTGGRPQSGEREVSEQSRGSSCARPILEANEPMTTENPADVIEQAAKVGAEAIYWTLEWEQLDDDTRSDAIEFARALHDAGLLADPADRDVKARLIAHRNVLRRMNRAEAEVARLRKLVEELGGTA